jgi:uncharacterized protein (TIGR02466 family)
MAKKEISIIPIFSNPVIQVQLDFDLEKLTEFILQMQNKDKKGVKFSNEGGWQSNNILEETHEEFDKLKKEITQYLQIYQQEIFRGMQFKTNVKQNIANMWVNINEKFHYNEWHIHPGSTIAGAYYIKHDGDKSGDILFKHPLDSYVTFAHWPPELVETYNEVSSDLINVKPKPNMLLIFPSWIKHMVEPHLNNDPRISISFNSVLESEKKP